MFLDVVSTHTKCVMNDFALAPRTDLLNFKCHTVTNGTDLRKSPLHSAHEPIFPTLQYVQEEAATHGY